NPPALLRRVAEGLATHPGAARRRGGGFIRLVRNTDRRLLPRRGEDAGLPTGRPAAVPITRTFRKPQERQGLKQRDRKQKGRSTRAAWNMRRLSGLRR